MNDGILVQTNVVHEDVLEVIESETIRWAKENVETVVLEAGGNTMRAVHGFHGFGKIRDITTSEVFLGTVQKILGLNVYIHQSKMNSKSALHGKSWPWHQDMVYWRQGDGVMEPKLVNAALCLDDMTIDNGPLRFFRGSHELGNRSVSKDESGDWRQDVSSDLRYQVPSQELSDIARHHPIVTITAPRGSIIWFHPNVIHSSLENLSQNQRRIWILTYNDCHNAPIESQRPNFLSAKDFSPLSKAHH